LELRSRTELGFLFLEIFARTLVFPRGKIRYGGVRDYLCFVPGRIILLREQRRSE
jgi:hypothetical protein